MTWRPDDWVSGYEENEALDGLDGPELYEAGANAIVEAAAIEAQKELVKELIAMLRPYGPKEMSLSGAIWLIEKHCKEKGLT